MTWINTYSLNNGDLARVNTYRGRIEGRVRKLKNGTIIKLNDGNDFKVKSLNHVQIWVNE